MPALQPCPGKGGSPIRKIKFQPKNFCAAVRVFALSVGATALCMLASWSYLEPRPQEALEASVFNGSQGYQETTSSAAPSGEAPGQVVPLGSAFGIKLFTDGVVVASLSDLYTANGVCCPAAEAGLKPGDYLLEADGMQIQSNAALASFIGQSQGQPITFAVRREGSTFEAQVEPVFSEGSFKTGMWVRDSAAGIGTLTFYDPETGLFAGLGHGICDMDTNGVMALKTGEPAPITLCGIVKGQPEEPGQLQGYFSSEEPLGRLLANSDTGVYGTLNAPPQGEAVAILPREEVREGPVQLLVSVDASGPRLYEGEITELLDREQRTKNFVVTVTDPELLAATGGIVQGMSGCPILQEGKLAGAVTHVFTGDPASGYGIFAHTMWEDLRAAG